MKNRVIIGLAITILCICFLTIIRDIYKSESIFISDFFLGAIKHDKEAWFTKTNAIGHAGGIYMGKGHTNSKEAIDLYLHRTVDEEVRVLELDFLFTSDNKLICAHLFENYKLNKNVTHDEFMKQNKLFTPIDFNDVIVYMLKNPNLYIMVDSKVENYDNRSMIDVAKYIIDNSPNSIKDRFIFQLYEPEQKLDMLKIYKFKDENLVYSLYKRYRLIGEVLDDCYKYNYNIILYAYGYFTDSEVDRLTNDGIKSCVFTINNSDDKNYIKKAWNGIVITDYLF